MFWVKLCVNLVHDLGLQLLSIILYPETISKDICSNTLNLLGFIQKIARDFMF